MLDISAALSVTNTRVVALNCRTTEDNFAVITLEVNVKDGKQLQSLMTRLNQVSGVLKVTRPAG